MSSIEENVRRVRQQLRAAAESAGRDPDAVRLLAATKQQSVDKIRSAIAAGVDAVGENRVQEMLQKDGAYAGTELHFIGRLQKNKIKSVVGRVSLIHSVDDLEQAECISDCAEALHIVQDVLLQVNIAREPTKGGFAPERLPDALKRLSDLRCLRVRGLMCIPPPPGDTEGVEGNKLFFCEMYKLFVDIRTIINDNRGNHAGDGISILSMGMSGDYAQAAAYGSTLVRVGSAIFGARTPQQGVSPILHSGGTNDGSD